MALADDDRRGLEVAVAEARTGREEGGIPIGSALMVDGRVVGRGHNRRVQRGSVVLHAEMDCLENAGRLPAATYRRATLYTTLSPCDMCTGAALLYGIPRVVVGEHRTFLGGEELLRSRGVEVVVVPEDETGCIDLHLQHDLTLVAAADRSSRVDGRWTVAGQGLERARRGDLDARRARCLCLPLGRRPLRQPRRCR